ncbi:MAG: hypothetical protein V5A36_02165 [Natronomonas sp.]
MSVTKQSPDSGADGKAFLFSPECSRSAAIEEGWSLDQSGGRTEINCPNCGTVLVSQPCFESEREPSLVTA